MLPFARGVRIRLGETGAGQTTKMVNQICIAGLLQGLAEGGPVVLGASLLLLGLALGSGRSDAARQDPAAGCGTT